MNNRYSIIIPFYYGEKYYPVLLQSILNAIKKCEKINCFFEIITIVDSVDSSLEYIEAITRDFFSDEKNVVLVNLKNLTNLGVAATRNKALQIAKGDYFHIIDQDDEVSADIYLESQKYLKDNNLLLFNGIMCYINGDFNTHKLYYLSPRLSVKGLIKDDFIRSPGQVIFSKKLLHEKLFPEPKQYKGADDRFFWLRLFFENDDIIRPKYINKACYIANIHESNFSNDRENLDRSCLENWDIFVSEVDVKEYLKLISRDILRVRYKLNENMSIVDRIEGFCLQLFFNLKLSKMLRFIVKRSKF